MSDFVVDAELSENHGPRNELDDDLRDHEEQDALEDQVLDLRPLLDLILLARYALEKLVQIYRGHLLVVVDPAADFIDHARREVPEVHEDLDEEDGSAATAGHPSFPINELREDVLALLEFPLLLLQLGLPELHHLPI